MAVSLGTAVLAAAAMLGFHLYPRTGLDRVRHVLDWSGCTSVDRRDGGPAYTRRWPGIRSEATLVCEDLGPQVFYARLGSSKERSAALRAAAPDEPYCVYGKAELVVYVAIQRAEREQSCGKLGGSLRRPSTRGRR
ncbi:MAG: hypothetical protein JWQ18_1067 [Conexibacter sp.]|nr:hypothetical protein [Conexibacter sp.]